MLHIRVIPYLIILLSTVYNVYTLECYVCDNQEDNLGKCVQTIKTCSYKEDVCLSEISWGSLPYFQEGALKQFYISKRCSTQEKCEKYRSSNMKYCTHIWYQDWKCSECCKGDRCNYYIISASSRVKDYLSLTVAAVTLTIFYRLFG